jgi:2-aminoadipate transaminase
MTIDANDVLVTSGAQQALDIATAVLGSAGTSISVPKACYPAALELFRSRGLTLATERPAALTYVMPAVANPSGRSLSAGESAAALGTGCLILEDDAYADLRFDGPAKPPLASRRPELVAHIGTFSKTLSPGLRVGWLVAPARYRDAARRAKQLTDLQANSLAQCIVERYLAEEDFDWHLAKLRRFYERRAEALVRAVRRELPRFQFSEPEGGFSLWLTSDEPGNDADLLATALKHGVSFDPGSDFRPEAEASPISLRLSFSSLSERAIEEAVQRLSRALRDYARAA